MQLKHDHISVNGWLLVMAIWLIAFDVQSNEQQEESLSLTPTQCVALTQGQRCYLDATLSWSAPTKGDYCLFSSQQEAPLFCWQDQNQGRLSREFATARNIVFSLRLKGSVDLKATQQLKVTWVHQKRGQPRVWWRIF